MKYNPRLKALTVTPAEMDYTYTLIMSALNSLRKSAGLPETPYEREAGKMTDVDHAAAAILDLGNNLGMEFEVTPRDHNKLDVSGY